MIQVKQGAANGITASAGISLSRSFKESESRLTLGLNAPTEEKGESERDSSLKETLHDRGPADTSEP